MKAITLPLMFCATLTGASAQTQTPAQVRHFESGPEGFNTRNFFYDNGEEVVVFDTQFTPELARKSIELIRSQTSNPITTVVITHPNPDKFNGAAEFQKLGAKVIGSEATAAAIPGVHAYKKSFFVEMAKMFTNETYPQEAQIDQTFTGRMDLKLRNGETLLLQELTNAGVSSSQTVVWIEKANALMVGDLVHHKAHAWLEGGIVNGAAKPTLAGWVADLEQIGQMVGGDVMIYGGRGEAATASEALPAQIQYLQKADAIVGSYIAYLADAKTELSGAIASIHYTQLQKIFEATFPDYQLGYMINYGVYGLVNSKL